MTKYHKQGQGPKREAVLLKHMSRGLQSSIHHHTTVYCVAIEKQKMELEFLKKEAEKTKQDFEDCQKRLKEEKLKANGLENTKQELESVVVRLENRLQQNIMELENQKEVRETLKVELEQSQQRCGLLQNEIAALMDRCSTMQELFDESSAQWAEKQDHLTATIDNLGKTIKQVFLLLPLVIL